MSHWSLECKIRAQSAVHGGGVLVRGQLKHSEWRSLALWRAREGAQVERGRS